MQFTLQEQNYLGKESTKMVKILPHDERTTDDELAKFCFMP